METTKTLVKQKSRAGFSPKPTKAPKALFVSDKALVTVLHSNTEKQTWGLFLSFPLFRVKNN